MAKKLTAAEEMVYATTFALEYRALLDYANQCNGFVAYKTIDQWRVQAGGEAHDRAAEAVKAYRLGKPYLK